MDRPLPKRKQRKALRWGAVGLLGVSLLIGLWLAMPRGLSVPAASARIGVVERGVFRDEVNVRSTAQSLQSTVLEAI